MAKKKLKLTLVSADDWEALYVNGKVYEQNHTVQLIPCLQKLGVVEIEEVDAYNDPITEERGCFPDKLSEVTPD